MTVEARELYSSSRGPIVSGSRTPFRANAHRARAERSLWRRIGEDQSGGNGTILQPVTRCAFSPMSELGPKTDLEGVTPISPKNAGTGPNQRVPQSRMEPSDVPASCASVSSPKEELPHGEDRFRRDSSRGGGHDCPTTCGHHFGQGAKPKDGPRRRRSARARPR